MFKHFLYHWQLESTFVFFILLFYRFFSVGVTISNGVWYLAIDCQGRFSQQFVFKQLDREMNGSDLKQKKLPYHGNFLRYGLITILPRLRTAETFCSTSCSLALPLYPYHCFLLRHILHRKNTNQTLVFLAMSSKF